LKRILLMVAALLTAAAAMPASAQQGKIGFVNTERIFRESAPAKRAEARLEAEFKKKDAELADLASRLRAAGEKLEKDGPVLSESQRRDRQSQLADMDREFQRKQRDYRDEVGQKRQTEFAEVLQSANRALKGIAEREGYDAIFQDAAYANPKLDLTDKVLKALADPAPATGAAK
jgi:outer membrane protein